MSAKDNRALKLSIVAATLSASAILTGCQTTGSVEPATESTQAGEVIQDSAARRAPLAVSGRLIDIPRFQGQLETEGPGLDARLTTDPQSIQSLIDSLEQISLQTSAEQYRQLDRSIDVIWRFGGFSSGFDKEGFLRKLDGMTGYDLISEANEIIRRREEMRRSR